MKRILLTCCFIPLSAPFAQAMPIDTGDSASHLSQRNAPATALPTAHKVPADFPVHAELSTFADETWVLPVHSALLSPGQITSRALNMPGLQAFFLVGDDHQSLTWLRERAVELQELGAAGFAVEVADAEALARIRALAPGVTILPVNGNDIASRLQIEHYPVLITSTSLEQ